MGAGVDMVYDCQRGECGLCAVDVLATEAEIDHRDVFFSLKQKRDGKRMCACVSRLVGGRDRRGVSAGSVTSELRRGAPEVRLVFWPLAKTFRNDRF